MPKHEVKLVDLMQCDETRPACVNCGVTSRTCVYALTPATRPGQTDQDGLLRPDQSPLTPGASSVTSSGSAAGLGPRSPEAVSPSDAGAGSQPPQEPGPHTSSPTLSFPFDVQPANMAQLELFHHACNSEILLVSNGDPTIRAGIVEAALGTPYVMNAVLGIAALHLSHIRPDQSAYYHHQAVHFHTHALSLFNKEQPQVTSENAVSLLLFSQFISHQVLYEISLAAHKHDEVESLDRFLGYLKVYRGVVVISRGAWNALCQSKIGGIFSTSRSVGQCKTSDGEETAELRSFISISRSLSNEQKQYCQDAIDRLQWIISRSSSRSHAEMKRLPDLSELLNIDGPNCLRQVLAWPCLAEESFLDLLCNRNPEALLILAYYGVVMHQHRSFWVYIGVGPILVRAIAQILGPNWQYFMAWPLAQICEEGGRDDPRPTET